MDEIMIEIRNIKMKLRINHLLRQVKQHLLNLPPTDHVQTVSGFVIAALEEKLRRDWIRQTPVSGTNLTHEEKRV
jgi:hypothetical protein